MAWNDMLDICITTRCRRDPAPGEYHFPKLEDGKKFGQKLKRKILTEAFGYVIDYDKDICGMRFMGEESALPTIIALVDEFYGAGNDLDISARRTGELASWNPRRVLAEKEAGGECPPAP